MGLRIDLTTTSKTNGLYMIPGFLENLYGQKIVKCDVYLLISSPSNAAT